MKVCELVMRIQKAPSNAIIGFQHSQVQFFRMHALILHSIICFLTPIMQKCRMQNLSSQTGS